MKTSIKAIALMAMMISIISGNCQTTAAIKSFHYRHSTPMAIYGNTEYDLKVNPDDGKVYITIDKGNPLSGTIEAEASVLDELQQIVNKYEIYKYRSKYINPEIADGSMWSLGISYDDGTYFTSSGTNEWPQNGHEAFGAIGGAMSKYRIYLWEGTFASCPTEYWDYGEYSKSDYSALNNSPFTITVGPVRQDKTCDVTFTEKGDYTLICTGSIDYEGMSIYLNDVKNGMLPSEQPYDWSKPIFKLSDQLVLTDVQELGIFDKGIRLRFAKPKAAKATD